MAHDETEPVGIGLAEAIGQVRAELARAIEEGKDSPVAFRAGPVDLEFEVGFQKTGAVDGGLQLSVLSLNAKRERSSTTTHRVRVTLTPVDHQGLDKLIDDVGALAPRQGKPSASL